MENEVRALLLEGRNCVVIWKKKLWLIVAMAIMGLAIGNVLALGVGESEYMATAKINSYTVSEEILSSYASLIPSLKYCEQAAEMLDDGYITAERIKEMVVVETTQDVPVVEISVYDTDKELTIKVANALAKTTINEINQQRGEETLQLLEEATTTDYYSNASVKAVLIRLGCMILAALATLVVLGVKAITSKKIVVAEDFTCGGQMALIGMIPLYEGKNTKGAD